MPARRSILCLVVALVLWPAMGHAQSPALIDAYERSSELYAQGRYQEALSYAKEALTLGDVNGGAKRGQSSVL